MTKALTRKITYPVLDTLFSIYRQSVLQNYDISKTIIVASSGRGGSTWLAEVVGTLAGYPTLWEPLHPNNNPECLEYGFGYNSYFRKDANAVRQRHYLKKILTGENLSTKVTSSLAFHPSQYLTFNGFIAKFVNANLLLPWLLQQFPMKALLMVRHPCAVISSQLRHGGWDHVKKSNMSFPKEVQVDYPHLKELFKTIETPEEILAFAWALKTYIPLSQSAPHPWCLVAYENLASDGDSEVERIFQYLEKPIPPSAYGSIHTPSTTTQSDSNVYAGGNSLTGWKDKLTSQQVDRILSVVHLSGVDFYTDELMPDAQKITGFSG